MGVRLPEFAALESAWSIACTAQGNRLMYTEHGMPEAQDLRENIRTIV